MTNQFRAVATATGANVLAPDQWANLGARQQGFVKGTAASRELNTAWRQGTTWAQVLGEFVHDRGSDALDDGDLDQLQANFEAALRNLIGTTVPDISLNHYGVASGSSDALIVSSTTPALLTPYVTGTTVLVRMPSNLAASAGATIKIRNGATSNLRRNRGASIEDGDIPANSLVPLTYDGSGWRIIGPAWGEIPRNETNPTLYVSPSGSDSTADGSTPQTAFRQPRQAILVGRQRYPLSATTLNIDIADGSYTPLGVIPTVAGTLNLIGNEANPQNVVISGSAAAGRGVNEFQDGAIVARGISFQNSGAGSHTIASLQANVSLINTRLISTSAGATGFHLWALPGSSINLPSNCLVAGDMGGIFGAAGGNIGAGTLSGSVAITVSGSPNYGLATAYAFDGGKLVLLPGVSFPNANNATGKRYLIQAPAIINANGGGANFLPGDQNGQVLPYAGYNP